ncbi:Protein kinase of the Mitotic Exit Network [Rhodotorula kratochvilovae]
MPHSLLHSMAVPIPAARIGDASALSTSPTGSSFLSRMAHFPLLGTGRGAKDPTRDEQRERRFSFGKPSKGRPIHSPHSTSPAPPLKRSKSARTSLLASARRLSSAATKRDKADAPLVSRPILADRNARDLGEGSSFMRDYRDRAHLFAMSSPELATPGEEKEQWSAWPSDAAAAAQAAAGPATEAPLSPTCPMVRWAADKENRSSFVPLSPTSMRPFSDSSSSLPSSHLSEESTATSVETDAHDLSASRATPPVLPFRRARSPKAKWSAPVLPSLSPPPASPVEGVSRSTSRSPPLDEAVRAANRAEAFAKLTSPTPTSTRFPDDLAAFPFPAMSSPPPAPTRPLPSIPLQTPVSPGSTSLILPPKSSLSPEDPTTPPPLVRSNTVGLHPTSVALDIDFKGRLVRARNSHPAPTASPSLTMSSSPGSSRFSDWHPIVGSRKSSETSFTLSTEDHGEQRAPIKGGLYALAAERRVVESAVDVLAIVEEDESPLSAAPLLRAKRSPSKRGSGESPQRRLSAGAAGKKRVSLDPPSPLHPGADVLVVPRTRARPSSLSPAPPTKPSRPPRLSLTDRSLSSGVVVEPTRLEKDELGLHSSPSQLHVAPLPLATRNGTPPRPRAGKRCISELHAEARPSSRERDRQYGLGLGLPSSLAAGGPPASVRTRHESLVFSGDEDAAPSSDFRPRRASRRVSSGAATRTKLVLREKGKPQLGECIGRGQFGSVYRALNLSSGQVVAVKRILLEGKTEHEIEQLSGEVSLLRRLAHPSIVRYEGAVRTEHYLNIILEYAESGSLEKTIKQFGQLPESLVASYTVKILEGLAYLHGQDVVHCDLKAANILSTKNGNIKLSDFGVSLNLHAIKATRGFHTSTAEANGTPNWMAPEVISLKGALPASDIWSLGATIVELIDGRPPYADLVAMSAMFRIVEDPNGPPIPERCSPELKAFLARCFRKNPKERPSAEDLFADPWLLKHFDISLVRLPSHQLLPKSAPLTSLLSSLSQDMRPQDSLPFLRRISTEYRRTPLVAPTFSLADALAERSSTLKPPAPQFVKDEPQGRTSFDSGYSAGDERGKSPEPLAHTQASEEAPPRPHSFVRSSFSKAIDCKICGEQTKRHAVLCKDCGLISHARCKEFAPSCDLRAQLLGFSASATHLPTSCAAPPLARFPTVPTSTPSSPSSSVPFAISDYLPFRHSRRPKPSLLSQSNDSHTNLPATVAAAGGAIRQLLTPSKSRTPESTPPNSLGRNKPGRPHSLSVSTGAHGRANNASTDSTSSAAAVPAVPPSSPMSAQGRPSLDVPLGAGAGEGVPLKRKTSRNVVVVQPGGARALGRRKSHARSVSQPVARLEGGAGVARVTSGGGAPAQHAPRGECDVM